MTTTNETDFFPDHGHPTIDATNEQADELLPANEKGRYKGPLYLTPLQVATRLNCSITFLRKHTNDYRALPGCIMAQGLTGRAKWLIPESALSFIPPKSATKLGRPRTSEKAMKLNNTNPVISRAAKPSATNDGALLTQLERDLTTLATTLRAIIRKR